MAVKRKQNSMQLSSRAQAFSVEALLRPTKTLKAEDEDQPTAEDTPQPPTNEATENSRCCTPTPSSGGVIQVNDISVELCGHELWQEFYKLGTEMIITKAGRRMFPALKIRVSGLDPEALYTIWLDIVSTDDKRYRYVYHSSQWMVAGSGDPPLPHNIYIHPESPAPGKTWMSQGAIAFDRLKLTNNRRPLVRGQVSLHSMHRYQPRIHITPIKNSEEGKDFVPDADASINFLFPETTFTTVTAYQNQQITRLKIASNPFAKGFREAAKSRESQKDKCSNSYITPSSSAESQTCNSPDCNMCPGRVTPTHYSLGSLPLPVGSIGSPLLNTPLDQMSPPHFLWSLTKRSPSWKDHLGTEPNTSNWSSMVTLTNKSYVPPWLSPATTPAISRVWKPHPTVTMDSF